MKAWPAVLSLLLLAARAQGAPWLPPGDEGLRHDIQLLADAGILTGPATTWPQSWPDIARDLVRYEEPATLDDATSAALARIRHRARAAGELGFRRLGVSASAAKDPSPLRSFAATPRDEGEVGANVSWLGRHVAFNLQGTLALDPADGQKGRADGSYLGILIGNWSVSAGFIERWWGPGWDGSLILSTNARPMPAVAIDRNYSDPFKTRLLSWIGPWRASISVSQAEGSGVPVADVRLLAARVTARPRPWLELGLSRTAQFCGTGRPCGFSTLTDLLIGRDNRSDSLSENDEPGNQMAGYDLRLRSPWKALPLALFTQWIGEDEAGGLPSKFLGLAGAEVWGSSGWGGWRLRAEYADTACTFTREQPDFNCGYRNTLYPQGYAYRGRIIGHSMDNDSRMYSVGGILVRPGGDVLSLLVRQVELNRDGTGSHALSGAKLDFDNVELRYSKDLGGGRVSLGLGYDGTSTNAFASGGRGFLTWQQGF